MAIITSKTIGNVREMCSFLMFAISNFLSSQAIFTIMRPFLKNFNTRIRWWIM